MRIIRKKHNYNAEQPRNRSRAVYKTGKDADHEFAMKSSAVPKSCAKKRYKSEKRTSGKSKHCPPGAKATTVPKQRMNFDLIWLLMVFTCLGLYLLFVLLPLVPPLSPPISLWFPCKSPGPPSESHPRQPPIGITSVWRPLPTESRSHEASGHFVLHSGNPSRNRNVAVYKVENDTVEHILSKAPI